MTRDQFRNKLQLRLKNRLKTQTFDEMTVSGSKLRFDMALVINGYPFRIPRHADEKDYTALLTDEQYQSGNYDDIIDEVFFEAFEVT